MISNKYISYGMAGVGVLGALLAFAGGGGILGLIGGILAALGSFGAILVLKYGYIIIPMITQQARIVVMTDTGYEIPPSQDVIIKKIGGIYYASTFLAVRIYESSTERSLEQNVAYNEYFERAISNLKYVVKIALMLYAENITEKRKIIETKRAESQLRLAREREKAEPDVLKMDQYERQVSMWDSQLNKLISGIRPMGVLSYAMTTAAGITKESAVAKVKSQARELSTTLANALNVQVEQLTGDEMLKCFEWEKVFPTSPEELESVVD
ncbi:hypothetical protein KAW38_03530 [Candidatus Micrarchaeota archaeon]|nr:hypothetical protein [Candidatus Micrarchaeota archaeon]